MIVSAHQPQYLPYLGFFHKMARSDLFIWLDDVQFKKREFQNRNRVRTPQGWMWLTVPVVSKGRYEQKISEVEIDEARPWRKEHWEALKHNYGRAPHYKEHAPFFEAVYARAWTHLQPLCLELCGYLCKSFGIKTPTRLASEFKVATASTQRLVELTKAAGGTAYLSGAGGRDYLEEGLFKDAGLGLDYQDFHGPEYPQCFPGFEGNLAAADFLFNVGTAKAADYFRS